MKKIVELIKIIIDKIINIINKIRKKKEEKEEKKEEEKKYSREDFLKALEKLSENPKWRARILRDALLKLREKYKHTYAEWIDAEKLRKQSLHRDFSCGISFCFGEGIHAIPKDTMLCLIKDLEQNMIVWRAEESDCDNVATAFKGFADFVVGKPVVIYVTGAVLRTIETLNRKVCLCKAEYLVGGHAWNRVAILEPIEYELLGKTETQRDNFTILNYEPQNDKIFEIFVDGYCYKSGFSLPVIYAYRL